MKSFMVRADQMDSLKQALRKIELGKTNGAEIIPLEKNEFKAWTSAIEIEYTLEKVEHRTDQIRLRDVRAALEYSLATTEGMERPLEESILFLQDILKIVINMIDKQSQGIPLWRQFFLKKLGNVRKHNNPINKKEQEN